MFSKSAASIGDILNNMSLALFGGSNGGVNIVSGKGKISAAHVAAIGSGGTAGSALLAVTQSGATGGGLRTTITAGGTLPPIDTPLVVENQGIGYSIADTLAVVAGELADATVHITAIEMEEYDYILVESGVIFTELKDANGTDLLTLKNLSGITFGQGIILNSGSNYKIRNMLFSGGNVFGYNV